MCVVVLPSHVIKIRNESKRLSRHHRLKNVVEYTSLFNFFKLIITDSIPTLLRKSCAKSYWA
jgi:hypothetical protein